MIIKLKLMPESILALPINYNYYVQSMIYRILQNEPGYSKFLHDTGYKTGGLKFRLFTFGGLFGHYTIINKHIIFDDIINLEIRSASEKFIFILMTALKSRTSLTLNGQKSVILNMSVSKQLIIPHRIEIKTISPIVASKRLADGYTRYYSPDEQEFENIISGNFKKKFAACYNIIPEDGISVIAREADTKHIVTRYQDTIINAYHAHLILGGNPQYLQFLYDTGLGAKNAQGFGMFDLCRDQQK